MNDVIYSNSESNPNYKTRLRSFVRRTGRMTAGQQQGLDEHWATYGLELEAGLQDFNTVFEREAPRVFEIGFGMGDSLLAMAKAAPDHDFIGVEVHTPGVGRLLAAAYEQEVTNLRVYHNDAVKVLESCVADASLDIIQVFFPDPWHKTRHHKRRLIQAPFLRLLAEKLKIDGVLHIATDWQPYAEHCLQVLSALPSWENLAEVDKIYIERPSARPLTKFEKRGQRLGHGVWDLMFKSTI